MRHVSWALFSFSVLCAAATSCGDYKKNNDPPAPYTPSPAGAGAHIADISDPSKPTCSDTVKDHCHLAPNAQGSVTGVVVTVVDNFDETRDGKSRGTVYVQDLESNAPYAGIGLFSPTFVPASLVVGPGDVVDLNGQYQENNTIGSTVTFPNKEVLPQLAKPSGTFRYEYMPPQPTEIQLSDLQNYSTGRRWIGSLVIVKDVTLAGAVTVGSTGRASGSLTAPGDAGDEAPALTNELMQIDAYPAGQKFKSITGVVTYFFNLHLAPRSQADLILE